MGKLYSSNPSITVPTRRARVMSAVRAFLNTAAVVALFLYFLGVDNMVAIAGGVICAPIAAWRSRRIAIRFAGNALAVDNYFRSYRVLDLDSALVHEYMRNRLELELPGGTRVYLQGANLQSGDERENLLSELAIRGAKVPTAETVDS